MTPTISRAQLHAALLSGHSATDVLEKLGGAKVTAHRSNEPPIPLRQSERALLHLPSNGNATHRRVELRIGDVTLSDADIWYVASRLPSAMVAALNSTDSPFGRVVRALDPRRTVLATHIGIAGDTHALEHRAVLWVNTTPIALVTERYRWDVLSLP